MAADWKLIRNEYEIMHTNVQELATSHHVSTSMIQLAITDGDWKLIEPDDLAVEAISERLAAMEAYHQNALVPKFIGLQATMLDKCNTLLGKIESIEDAPMLKIISEVIEKHRPSIMGVKKEGVADNTISIKIATQVGGGGLPSVAAVEIASSAGDTNGVGAVSYGYEGAKDITPKST